jgi:hypothetical protein
MHSSYFGIQKEILTSPENCGASENLAIDCCSKSNCANLCTEDLTSDTRCDVCSIRLSKLVQEGSSGMKRI